MNRIAVSRASIVAALLCFVLAAFHVTFPIDIIAAGLAFLAASFLLVP